MSSEHRSSQRVVVPEHVVYREFAAETVVLNLETGQYHGLNPVAGRMLQAAETGPSIARAIEILSDEYSQPADRIRTDLDALLDTLEERGIVTFVPASAAGN